MSIATSLPDVKEVRRRIEQTRNLDVQFYLKALYLFGALPAELSGTRCSGEKQVPYGPKGTDVELLSTQPPDPSLESVRRILNEVKEGISQVDKVLAELTREIPVAVFKIRTAKRKFGINEEIPFRLVALPMRSDLEPWTEDLYKYFKERKDEFVFECNRQHYWHYLTNVQDVFAEMRYQILEYVTKEDDIIIKKTGHKNPFKLQALRNVRTYELITKYGFDLLDLNEYVGTKLVFGNRGLQVVAETNLHHNWQRYIKKLCKA